MTSLSVTHQKMNKCKRGSRQKEEEEKEREPGTCCLFIQKRGRYCRLSVAKGSKYCGEHLNFDPEMGVSSSPSSSQRKRIPCPLDPHHTVYEHQLETHLRKCNAAKKGSPACYRANVNTGIRDYQLSEEEKKPLSAFPQSELDSLIAKVEKVYRDHQCHIEEVVLEHPAMYSDLSDRSNGATALKHLRQQASILGHLEKLQLLQPHTCFIEFGAGRGKLSNCLQRACFHDNSLHYLLVDRSSCRRKVDVYRRHGDHSHEARVQRLLIDIEHLDLGKVKSLQNDDVRHVVAISKHLCGSATDLTLRCLLETMTSRSHDQQPMRLQNTSDVTEPHRSSPGPPDVKRACTASSLTTPPAPPSLTPSATPPTPPSLTLSATPPTPPSLTLSATPPTPPSPTLAATPPTPPSLTPSLPPSLTPYTSSHLPPKLRGVVIALCCHHRCAWSQLVGTEWLSGCGFTPLDIHLIMKMTSWAVCGVRGTTERSLHDSESDHAQFDDASTHIQTISDATDHTSSYHPHPCEGVGLMCKRLLDLTRLHYLRERGMEGRLLYFVPRQTSLENVLLIATPTAAHH